LNRPEECRILVLWHLCPEPLRKGRMEHLCAGMPSRVRQSVQRLKRPQGQSNAIAGKLLLAQGLHRLGVSAPDLSALAWTSHGKPYLRGGTWFSISHSGRVTVCGLSRQARVGIDLERMEPIEVAPLCHHLPEPERLEVLESDDPLSAFYQAWAKREAVLKADGRGITIPEGLIHYTGRNYLIDKSKWRTEPLDITLGYACHLAADRPGCKVLVEPMGQEIFPPFPRRCKKTTRRAQ
jgi:4'-phosphopantetheinyl transferase